MVYSFNDLKCKEVINIKSGCRLGYPDDIEFENCTAKICRIIIFGKAKFFGLFGREDDISIKWCDIEVIGEDTILVSCEIPSNSPNKRGKFLGNLFK
jgi:YlmC/YmxH family sporulation protein